MARESLSVSGGHLPSGLTVLVIGLFSVCLAPSCSMSGTELEPSDEIVSVAISPPQATVGIGETTTLTAVVRNGHGDIVQTTVEWSSTAPDIALVDTDVGLVRGVAAGIATINASAAGKTGSASVTVRLLPTGPG